MDSSHFKKEILKCNEVAMIESHVWYSSSKYILQILHKISKTFEKIPINLGELPNCEQISDLSISLEKYMSSRKKTSAM